MKIVIAAMVAVLAVAVSAGQAQPTKQATAEWTYYDADNWGFWDYTGARVWTQGQVRWYRDFPSKKGYLYQAYGYTKVNGYLWVKLSWNTVTGTASWPPSGSANSTSDGWLRLYRNGNTWYSFAGQAYTSTTLVSTTVCIGFSSTYNPNTRLYQSCKKLYAGFN